MNHRNFWQRPVFSGLVRQFRIYSLIAAILGFAAASVILLPAPIADRLLRDDMVARAENWHVGLSNLLAQREATFSTAQLTADDEFALELFVDASDVYRFKMFTADGRIFYSSRADEIGAMNTKPYFQDVVAMGQYYFKQDVKLVSEIDGFSARNINNIHTDDEERLVAEIYVPVIIGGKFAGAVEFYRDITDIHGLLVSRVRAGLALFATVGTMLSFITIGALVVSGNRRLRHVQDGSRQERNMMAEQTRLTREVKLLSELNEWLQSSRSLDELFEMVSAFMSRLLCDCAGSIYVYSNSRDVLDGACNWNGGELHDHIRPEACWGLRRGRSYAFGTSEIDFICEHVDKKDHDGRPYFCFPVLAHGETVGLMHMTPKQGISDEKFRDIRKLAQMCAEQISLAIANVQMRDQLQQQSVRDPLTGLYNRRHFLENLRKHLGAAKTHRIPLSLISIDVDHFKKFNDNHGHDAGDMVLRAVGSTLEHLCDGDEIACRLGGEEFIAMLPTADAAEARIRAEKIRLAVEKISVRYGEKTLPRITISLGISTYPSHGTMPQDLLKAADNALYDAKARGRNQICIAGQEEGAAMAPVLTAVKKNGAKPGKSATPAQNPAPKPAQTEHKVMDS